MCGCVDKQHMVSYDVCELCFVKKCPPTRAMDSMNAMHKPGIASIHVPAPAAAAVPPISAQVATSHVSTPPLAPMGRRTGAMVVPKGPAKKR
jgi:hypothetical protein